MLKKLYMIVDNDHQDLPLFIGTLKETAEWANTTPNVVLSAICNAKKRKTKTKFAKVEIEEEE